MATPLYGRGEIAWGICQRCGLRDLLENLVLDGYYPNIRVHPECWDDKHPQERLEPLTDATALWRPSPETNNVVAPVLSGVVAPGENSLTWTAATTLGPRFENYQVYRSVRNTDGTYPDFTLLTTGPITYDTFMGIVSEFLAYVDHDITGETVYSYYVAAVDSYGRGVQSNIIDLDSDIGALYFTSRIYPIEAIEALSADGIMLVVPQTAITEAVNSDGSLLSGVLSAALLPYTEGAPEALNSDGVLSSGDLETVLLGYTDGAPEAVNSDGQILSGDLEDVLLTYRMADEALNSDGQLLSGSLV